MNALMPPPVPDVDPDWLAVRKTHLINELTRSGKHRRRYVLSAAATRSEHRLDVGQVISALAFIVVAIGVIFAILHK